MNLRNVVQINNTGEGGVTSMPNSPPITNDIQIIHSPENNSEADMQVANQAAHKTLPEFEGIEEELVNEEFAMKERKASA
jgi:hypothetical protein